MRRRDYRALEKAEGGEDDQEGDIQFEVGREWVEQGGDTSSRLINSKKS